MFDVMFFMLFCVSCLLVTAVVMKYLNRHVDCVYGPVKGGYQFCEVCGKAIKAPCVHDYQYLQEMELNVPTSGGHFDTFTKQIYICTKCKEIKEVIIK